ncbi:hypothetical protein LTR56_018950 [Elasticomyces elasticus]|nr:hypothetical protein LTR56_018950 [Elasticomyces elasticus]KAK3649889.1 hypothetical protein LTR22_012765 [Elasticomyces elasticus]KAK4918160.1 hypothetical protein LTR49_014016 [Elasticomyces elasticus]KAK5757706.1 hypothetical protein LTS12_012165 [Elasticomyces elasticus]
MPSWTATNGAPQPPNPTNADFTITAFPKTDIWRRDSTPEGHVFDAPYLTTLVKVSEFKSVKVEVTVPWKTQFDQGGLLIIFPAPKDDDGGTKGRWVKGGIEFFQGKPALGVVGTDRFSDWSLAPTPQDGGDGRTATFEAVKDGTTLWVYVVVDGKRQALREIKWAFVDVADDEELKVGVYAAKPTPDEGDEKAGVEVGFSGLSVESS